VFERLVETGEPEEGVNIRIRCRWNGVRQAMKSHSALLEELKIDGIPVKAEEVIKGFRNTVSDAYYLYKWGIPEKGNHMIEARVKDLRSGITRTYTSSYIQK
jgi:hypothetical protein